MNTTKMTNTTNTNTTEKKAKKIWSTIQYKNGKANVKSVDLNLYFTKEVDRLDFTIRMFNDCGKMCSIDGFVARVWGTNRYYVNSEIVPIDFKVTDDDVFGVKNINYWKWIQTEGHYTLKGAIKHHLETVWGITVEDEIKMPQQMQTFVRQEAINKIVTIVKGIISKMGLEYNKTEVNSFARGLVNGGKCFVDKGSDLPKTIAIGVYNFNGNAVAEMWNEKYKAVA